MKRLVVFVLSVCFCATGLAQDWAKVSTQSASDVRLNVGDKIPFTELHNMLNYPKKTLKLSDSKPKLIILDFWATTCGPCVKFWPTLLKLQEEFGKDLQIIAVNRYERAKLVETFLAKRKKIDGFYMNLPMSARDSTLWKNFPDETLPRYVWIGPDGVVGAITHGKDMTRENIKKWMTSGPFVMDEVIEKKWYGVVPYQPIFVNGNGGTRPGDAFIWTSSLTKGQDNIPADCSITYDSLSGYGILLTGGNILTMYGHAYNNRLREWDFFDFLPYSRMELIAQDTAKYHGILGGIEDKYNYQLICGKPQSREQLLGIMREDIKRYFGLDVKWEKRLKKCFVFSMFDSTLAMKQKSRGAEVELKPEKIIMDSVTVKDITTCMEMATWYYRSMRYPIVDETGYNGLITGIREEADATNLVEFNKVLSKCGLRLKLEMREVDILVLREPGKLK